MPDSIPTTYEVSQLVDELLVWFETADQDQILEYIKNAPQEFWASWFDVSEFLLSKMRINLSKFYNENVSEGLASKISEIDRISLFRDLARYEANSVFANYQRKYPNQVFKNPTKELAGWAQNYLKIWGNVLLFLTGKDYQDSRIYLNSMIKSGNIVSNQVRLYQEGTRLVKELSKTIANNNYQKHNLSVSLSIQIKAFFDNFDFLPQEYVENLFKNQDLETLFNFLGNLVNVLSLVRSITESKVDLEKADLDQMLWSLLAFDLQKEVFVHYEVDKRIEVEPISGDNQFMQNLFPILRYANIKSGGATQTIQAYLKALSSTQRIHFLEVLRDALINSPDVQELFTVVDIEYFLDTIQNWSKPSSKADFVNSLEDRVLPEYWPIIQPFMLFLATIYN